MAEELAFARKASGLVRGLSMWDAFAVGFMNQGLTPSIWVTISLGVGVFLGGNLIIACLISTVLAGIGFPIVWGILGGSMPRSGGEYIYNSRIIHPMFGIAQSFGDAVDLAVVDLRAGSAGREPGPRDHVQLHGLARRRRLGRPAPNWRLLPRTLFNIVGFMFVVFGIKIFALTQKIVMFFGIGGCIVIGIVLTFSSRANFVAQWDKTPLADALADLPRLHHQGRVRPPVRPSRAPGTGRRRSAPWSPCRGCSPTPTRSRSSPAR